MLVKPEHITIEMERKDKRGGQCAGTPPHYLVLTHVPTQIIIKLLMGYGAHFQTFRSQHKAKNCALDMLEYALLTCGYENPEDITKEINNDG